MNFSLVETSPVTNKLYSITYGPIDGVGFSFSIPYTVDCDTNETMHSKKVGKTKV